MQEHSRSVRFIDCALSVVSVLTVLLLLYYILSFKITRVELITLFLGLVMVISTLTMVRRGSFLKLKGKWLAGLAFIFIAIAIVTAIYFFKEFYPISVYRIGAPTDTDLYLSLLLLIPLLVLLWKEAGPVLFLLVLFYLFYIFYGNLFPGILHHKGFSFSSAMAICVSSYDGVYGTILGIMATWVTVFLLFAGMARGFGALDVIIKVFYRLFGGRRYLMPQIPVVASMIFGSFSGSATANIAGTGSFTIPLMKGMGIPPKTAGAIEAVASSGGLVMPPIMGIVAFLMADLLGVPYLYIVVIGFIPATIFYVAAAAGTYWTTKPYMQVARLPERDDESMALPRRELARLAPLAVGVIVLFTLLVLRLHLMHAALYATFALLAAQIVYALLTINGRPIWGVIRQFAGNLHSGVRYTAEPAAMVGIMGASLGIVVRAMTVTGLGPKLSFTMIDLAHGNLPLMLLLVFALALILGMAGGGIVVYVVMVFIVATPLLKFGVEPITTHFTIFYLSTAALVTPPVAGAALVASGIAGATFMSTAWHAMRLGLPLLIMPFAFITHPELINPSAQTPIAIALAMTGTIGLAYAFFAPERGWKVILKRVVCFIAGGIALFHPAVVFYIMAAVVIVVLLAGGPLLRRVRRAFG